MVEYKITGIEYPEQSDNSPYTEIDKVAIDPDSGREFVREKYLLDNTTGEWSNFILDPDGSVVDMSKTDSKPEGLNDPVLKEKLQSKLLAKKDPTWNKEEWKKVLGNLKKAGGYDSLIKNINDFLSHKDVADVKGRSLQREVPGILGPNAEKNEKAVAHLESGRETENPIKEIEFERLANENKRGSAIRSALRDNTSPLLEKVSDSTIDKYLGAKKIADEKAAARAEAEGIVLGTKAASKEDRLKAGSDLARGSTGKVFRGILKPSETLATPLAELQAQFAESAGITDSKEAKQYVWNQKKKFLVAKGYIYDRDINNHILEMYNDSKPKAEETETEAASTEVEKPVTKAGKKHLIAVKQMQPQRLSEDDEEELARFILSDPEVEKYLNSDKVNDVLKTKIKGFRESSRTAYANMQNEWYSTIYKTQTGKDFRDISHDEQYRGDAKLFSGLKKTLEKIGKLDTLVTITPALEKYGIHSAKQLMSLDLTGLKEEDMQSLRQSAERLHIDLDNDVLNRSTEYRNNFNSVYDGLSSVRDSIDSGTADVQDMLIYDMFKQGKDTADAEYKKREHMSAKQDLSAARKQYKEEQKIVDANNKWTKEQWLGKESTYNVESVPGHPYDAILHVSGKGKGNGGSRVYYAKYDPKDNVIRAWLGIPNNAGGYVPDDGKNPTYVSLTDSETGKGTVDRQNLKGEFESAAKSLMESGVKQNMKTGVKRDRISNTAQLFAGLLRVLDKDKFDEAALRKTKESMMHSAMVAGPNAEGINSIVHSDIINTGAKKDGLTDMLAKKSITAKQGASAKKLAELYNKSGFDVDSMGNVFMSDDLMEQLRDAVDSGDTNIINTLTNVAKNAGLGDMSPEQVLDRLSEHATPSDFDNALPTDEQKKLAKSLVNIAQVEQADNTKGVEVKKDKNGKEYRVLPDNAGSKIAKSKKSIESAENYAAKKKKTREAGQSEEDFNKDITKKVYGNDKDTSGYEQKHEDKLMRDLEHGIG